MKLWKKLTKEDCYDGTCYQLHFEGKKTELWTSVFFHYKNKTIYKKQEQSCHSVNIGKNSVYFIFFGSSKKFNQTWNKIKGKHSRDKCKPNNFTAS